MSREHPEDQGSAIDGHGFFGPDDPPAFEVVNARGAASVVLLCDHASNRVPAHLASLGLPGAELERHIAWDIGIAAVTRHLARLLDSPTVLSGYSRLVIDCNRTLQDVQSIPETSDDTVIPGNRNLTTRDVEDRVRYCFSPYHEAASRMINDIETRWRPPAVICMHSFTPSLNGVTRPWHVGVLWEWDGRMALPALEGLRQRGDLVVGDNEPYSARALRGYSMPHHASRDGGPCLQLEIRQDLIADEVGAETWAGIIAEVVRPTLADDSLYQRFAPGQEPTRRNAPSPAEPGAELTRCHVPSPQATKVDGSHQADM